MRCWGFQNGVAVQIAQVPSYIATVPRRCVANADRDRMIVYPPVRDTVNPRLAYGVPIRQIVPHILATFVGGDTVPHQIPSATVDVHPSENVPQAGHVAEVYGLATIDHNPFCVPVLAELPLTRKGSPIAVRSVIEHPRLAVCLMVAVRINPENIYIVHPMYVVATLI